MTVMTLLLVLLILAFFLVWGLVGVTFVRHHDPTPPPFMTDRDPGDETD